MPAAAEVASEYRRFYSNDPHEVLGVSRTASPEEIDKARKKLLRKYHPDVNKDALATEISQRINNAYDIVIKKDTGNPSGRAHERPPAYTYRESHTYNYPPREPRQEAPPAYANQFYQALRRGPQPFADYLRHAKKDELTATKIKELLNSEQGRQALKEGLLGKIKIFGRERSDECLEYVAQWRQAGVEMRDYFKLPEVKKLLEDVAVNSKIKIWGKDDAKVFLEYVDSWKKAGVDLGSAVRQPEAHKFLEFQAIQIKIKIYGTDNADTFLKFAEEWRKAGVDLKSLVNSPDARDFLEKQARHKLKLSLGRPKFEEFVRSWMAAGWQPSREILSLLQQA